MEKICLDFDTYDDIMFFESLKKGSYGNVVEYSDDTLLKLYYDRHYEMRDKSIPVQVIQSRHDTELKEIEQKIDTLKNTEMSDLYKGIVECNGCIVGVIMTYYKEYQSLFEIKDSLTEDEKLIISKKAKVIFNNLVQNGCYPLDLSQSNIMVRKSDLDVKIIDLDDIFTQYQFNLDDDEVKNLVKLKMKY